MQEPLDNDYPTSDEFRARYPPRGIIHSFASDTYDDSVPDERFGEIGMQTVEDTGLPTAEEFETLDARFNDMAFDFMESAAEADEPFFVWLNPSRINVFNLVPDEYKERAREFTSYDDPHGAGMMQLDDEIGTVMAKLEELGIADDTIVSFTTDNGPEHSTYPEGGTTPFRSEKMSTWEDGPRVPFVIRWPDHIEARTEVNGIQTLMDVFATLASAAGVDYEDLRQRLMGGDDLGTGTVKTAYLDGIDMSDYWADPSQDSPRDNYIYWAESSINALRVNQWKAHFRLRDGYCGTTEDLEIVRVYNIRHDPFESFDQYPRTLGQLPQHKSWTFNTILGRISEHLATWQQYPPAQRGSSLSTNQLVDQLLEQQKGAKALSHDLRLRCPRGRRGRCESSRSGDPAWRRRRRKREPLAGARARRLTPDASSKELRGALVAHGHGFGCGTIRRFIRRHARAKSARAGEQDRASCRDGLPGSTAGSTRP